MTPGALLAEVTRQDVTTGRHVVESVHTGHLVDTGPDGEVVAAIGDPDVVTFVRSTVKPLQVTACLELLGQPADRLSSQELAVAWASHAAEPEQLAAVRRLLERSGTDPADLTCPPAVGDADPAATPSRLQHNCSGKHALFALTGARTGVDRARLLDVDGPLQRAVLALLTEVLGPPAAIGVDGCGAPAVAVPLRRLAQAYAHLATDERFDAVRAAGLSYPGHVGGRGRLESALLAAGVVAKVGAEGTYAVGYLDADGRSHGLAVTSADGATRGSAVATVAWLVGRGVVSADVWAPPPPLGGGRPAGVVRAVPAVREAAARVSG